MVTSLIDGFTDFRNDFFGQDKAFFKRLIRRGQHPKIMIISCSDSRVDPAILFGTRPGELFVIRNVANLVPPYQPDDQYHGISAAIEFGVRDLGVEDIVILGHAYCGGVNALCEHARGEAAEDREFITPWIKIALPALDELRGSDPKFENIKAVEQHSIMNSLNNLRTFPWLAEREKQGSLALHGWWFDMDSGALWCHSPPDRSFTQMIPSVSE